MPTYKTPDVYVEEISIFPRSVAEVETAVPAFIGYTEKSEFKTKSLLNVPTRIRSLVEFEERFGGGPPIKIDQLVLDQSNVVQDVTFEQSYLLYDSLQLFFKNGGGKCYIIAVGHYGEDIDKAKISAGLEALKKQDEPTLILFPDAIRLDKGLYDLQKEALAQCNQLMDRFVIMDLLETREADAAFGWQEGIEEFRNEIGVNYLKYGAAYTPYLKSSLSKTVTYRELKDHVTGVRNLSSDPEVLETFSNLDNAIADNDVITAANVTKLAMDYEALLDEFRAELNKGAANVANVRTKYQTLLTFVYQKNKALVDTWATDAGPLKDYGAPDVKSLRQYVRDKIASPLRDLYETLNSYHKEIDARVGGGGLNDLYAGAAFAGTRDEWKDGGNSIWDAANIVADNSIFPEAGADDDERIANLEAAESYVTFAFNSFKQVIGDIAATGVAQESTFESSLEEQYPLYKNIVAGVAEAVQIVPPSGAIAGVYCAVDNDRGVWKAPANVSLTAVAGLTEIIDSEEQEDLNVDVVAGKSINAIRPFTGRGLLVWGARTLAGNDLEWRYVSVRRFFNMVEESVKKSTYWAVFEPNDANLWIKVKSMIENYLTQKWRDGALAGAKPDDAYFVNVGLGVTMTPQDILEGRLIVEIGMAVVRPAEFIILRFSHKMQES